MDRAPTYTDPLQRAVSAIFGLSSLFPYQRLVISNILEAAVSAGMSIDWPAGPAREEADLEQEIARAITQEEVPGLPPEAGEATVIEASPRGQQIVILPTGAGKSLCFQLPALLLNRPTLVIYPILSLMGDQARRLEERGFSCVTLRGGQSKEEREGIFEKIRTGAVRFIIANPEVLLTDTMLDILPGLGIGHFVIDEAHCVSEWGESFRPSYLEIARIAAASGAHIITAFTATASPPVLAKIERYIFGREGVHRIIGNPDRPNIRYYAMGAIDRDMAVLELLERFPRPAIVFCSSREGCAQLARFLRARGPATGLMIETRFYHATLERDEKETVNEWFLESPDGVLCATCAWGMGVDKANIRTVIHRDCAPSVEAYLQESGRAGRDGGLSHAILLHGPDDEGARLRASKEADRERLDELLAYAREAKTCRREQLMKLMGAPFEFCPGCDACAGMANGGVREEGIIARYLCAHALRKTVLGASRELATLMGKAWSSERVALCLRALLVRGTLKRAKHGPWKGLLVYGKGRAERTISLTLPLHPLLPLEKERVLPLSPASGGVQTAAASSWAADGQCKRQGERAQ